jgi:hypothetical protein
MEVAEFCKKLESTGLPVRKYKTGASVELAVFFIKE